jgi:hypothetical protein
MGLGRTFPIERIDKGDTTAMAAKIECCDCGAVAYSSSHGGLNPIAHEQHFRKSGWNVGNGPRRDLCPECSKPKKKPDLKVVQMDPVKAEQPREMGREDRRIITDKLDDVYDEKSGRYKAPWTDNAVSKDLGVPRAWVSDVREQFFGPEGSNPDFDAFLKQSAPIIADMKNLANSARAQLEQVRAVESRIAELERLGRKIEKELGR